MQCVEMKEKFYKEYSSQFQRTRNVRRNMVFGLLNRCVSLLLPFIVRTVLIYRFGVLYLGMNSVLSSIFQVLNLAELGFGTAVVYSLYRPVAERDTDSVCAYLGTFRKIYRIIGLVILAAGLALMPFFPYLVKDNPVPGEMNLYIWYGIFLADAVVRYLLYGYKMAIPSALQRNDLLSKIDTVIQIGSSVLKISCLLLSDNFYYYLLTSLLFTVYRNLLISHVVNKRFPQYVCQGRISEGQFAELKLLVGGLALSKFRGTSRHAIDSICITAFVSLAMTAIYSNYFLIHSAVVSLSVIICNAMMASVGNSIAMESRQKNYLDMRRFNFMYMLLAGWASICFLCLYQSFVRLWIGERLMLHFPEVIALTAYFYVLKMGDIRWVYFEGAGLWWQARYIALAEMLANICLNLLLVRYFGVLGIILATLITLFFIDFIFSARLLFQQYYCNGKLSEFFGDHVRYFMVTVLLAVPCIYVCNALTSVMAKTALAGTLNIATSTTFGILELLVRLLICTVFAVVGYFLIYHRTAQFKEAKEWVMSRYSALRG